MSGTRPSVAVLGSGVMGAAIARRLLHEGFPVTVWNRSLEKTRPLADAGAVVAPSVAEAVAAADIVITMLFDGDSVADAVGPALGSFRGGAVWVQASTVGVEGARRLAGLARDAGIDFLDAPMLGTRAPAENGQLVVLAAGPSRLAAKVESVFAAIGSRTHWIGDTAGDASKLKLVVNAWVVTVVNGVGQSIALARALGLDPQQFLDVVRGQGVDAPYVQLRGRAMIQKDFTPSFALDGAIKDTQLIAAAAEAAGLELPLLAAVLQQFVAASDQGHGAADAAAVLHAYGDIGMR
jgi:3-hydroxyisobutyrate dehydrogenase